MDDILKFQALTLALWYIELSLLYILEYNGKYIDRCELATTGNIEETYVPWTTNM
jgi:hypothetical protein